MYDLIKLHLILADEIKGNREADPENEQNDHERGNHFHDVEEYLDVS